MTFLWRKELHQKMDDMADTKSKPRNRMWAASSSSKAIGDSGHY
jgi:hypothetical protein